MRAHTRLAAEPTSPRAARRFVAGALSESGLGEVGDLAALLVTELVTNAILHARSPVDLTVDLDPSRLRISVGDASDVIPTPRRHSLDAATGRGLQLVAELAQRWGAEPTPAGKSVWFELPVHGSGDPPDRWLDGPDRAAS